MRPVTIVAAVLALAGCGGRVAPLQFLEPQLDLRRVGVRSLGLQGGTLELTFAIANPNNIRVRGTRIDAGLDLQDTHFGDVVLADAFALTANDTTLLTVPLMFRWSGVGAAARAILDYGEVAYALKGTLSVDTPAGSGLAVPFTRYGNIPLLKSLP